MAEVLFLIFVADPTNSQTPRSFDEDAGLVVFGVGNEMPDVNGTGLYSGDSWTLLKYAGNNQWSREVDIDNPDAMLTMLQGCYDAAGLPFPEPELHT
jgi:hypothetical protein